MSDYREAPAERPGRFRPLASLLVAIRFLTRLPVPFVRTLDPPPLSAAMGMFPVAGALIGVVTGGALIAGQQLGLASPFAAVCAVAFGLLITGGFHEDGLADVADGIGGGATVEQRLDIMRDSRIGAYGTMALVLALMARAMLFADIMQFGSWQAIVLLACGAAFSRALVVDLLWATRPARRDGLSVMAGRPGRNTTLFALCLGGVGAGIGTAYVLSPAHGALSLVAAGIATATIRALAMRKIGGQTGDVCGAAQVISEITMLAVFTATLSLD
jgi:adenosylcobinamide-GDP ribazoletransferase